MIQIMLETPSDFALIPACAQGEIEDNPKPVPSMSKIRESAAAPAAPAKIAPQETALVGTS